jgi:hypothetical protein
MGIRYDMKDVADVIEKFDAKSKELVALISDACKKAGIDFKLPRWAKTAEEATEDEKATKVKA